MSAPAVAAPRRSRRDPLAPGYVVEGHLSRNQVLDVYEVWSAERDCLCVAKVLRPDCRTHARRGAARARGRLLLELAHPHLVRAYEVSRPRARRRPRDPRRRAARPRHHARGAAAARRGDRRARRAALLRGRLSAPSRVAAPRPQADKRDRRRRHREAVRPVARPAAGAGEGALRHRGVAVAGAGRGDAFGEATDAFGLAGVLFAAATRRSPCPWRRGEGGGAPRRRGAEPAPAAGAARGGDRRGAGRRPRGTAERARHRRRVCGRRGADGLEPA